jgi:hypothetical protein
MGIGHKLLLVTCGVGLGFGLAKLLDNVCVIEIEDDDKEVPDEELEDEDDSIFENEEGKTTAEA